MRAVLCAIFASITLLGVGCQHNVRQQGDCCGSGQSCGCGQGMHDHGGRHAGLLGRRSDSGMADMDDGGGNGHSGNGHGGNGHSGLLGGRAGRPSHVARLPHGYMEQQMQPNGGPMAPTVAYPYYTTRAPRDFLMANPPSIGP